MKSLIFNLRYKLFAKAKGHDYGGVYKSDVFAKIFSDIKRYFTFLHSDILLDIFCNKNVITIDLKDFDKIRPTDGTANDVMQISSLFHGFFLRQVKTYMANPSYINQKYDDAVKTFSVPLGVSCSAEPVLQGLRAAWESMLYIPAEHTLYGKMFLDNGLEDYIKCSNKLFIETIISGADNYNNYRIEYAFPPEIIDEFNDLCSYAPYDTLHLEKDK